MALANVNSPRGFQLLRASGLREPRRVKRHVLATRTFDLGIGDAYTLDGSMNAVQAIGTEGSIGTVRGIVEGIILAAIAASPNGPVSQDYIPAADAGDIIGIEDNNCDFLVQATLALATDFGQTADLVNFAVFNEPLRQSRQEIDSASVGASKNFIMIQLLDSPADNALGAFAKIVVRLRNAF